MRLKSKPSLLLRSVLDNAGLLEALHKSKDHLTTEIPGEVVFESMPRIDLPVPFDVESKQLRKDNLNETLSMESAIEKGT